VSSRLEFAQKLKDRGATPEQAKQAFDLYRQKNGAFDDEQPQQAAPEEKGMMDYLLPTANNVEGGGLGASGKRIGLGLLDALNIPTRALATLSGQSMADPHAYLAKPIVDALKFAPDGETEQRQTQEMDRMGPGGMVSQNTPIGGLSLANMGMERAGQMASDPISLLTLIKSAADPLMNSGAKIYESALKPSKALVQKNGLDAREILDAGYGGSFPKGLEKLEGDMSGMNDQVRNIVADKMAQDPHAVVDLTQSLANTKKTIAQELMQGQHAGLQGEMSKGIDEWGNDLASRPLGVTDPATALDYQRGVGAMGRWDKNVNPQMVPAKSRVANQFYGNIGNDLESVVPGIAPIRKEISTRIPMRQALEDAAARTAKNNPISLTDVIAAGGALSGANMAHSAGGGLPGLLFGALNKATKSPQVGNLLYQTGKSLETQDPIRDAIQRALMVRNLVPQEDQN
jgi:hypothetical protein